MVPRRRDARQDRLLFLPGDDAAGHRRGRYGLAELAGPVGVAERFARGIIKTPQDYLPQGAGLRGKPFRVLRPPAHLRDPGHEGGAAVHQAVVDGVVAAALFELRVRPIADMPVLCFPHQPALIDKAQLTAQGALGRQVIPFQQRLLPGMPEELPEQQDEVQVPFRDFQ